METIVEYRADLPPLNEYPHRIISPVSPSACCVGRMEKVGRGEYDGAWRFYYKRCPVCGFTVRCVYAPSLVRVSESIRPAALREAGLSLLVPRQRRRSKPAVGRRKSA